MNTRSCLLISALLSFTLPGCSSGSSSSDGSGGDAGAGGSAGTGGGAGTAGRAAGSGRLDPAARDELLASGADEFFGQAEVMEATENGNVKSFVFDPASGPVCVNGTPFPVHIRDSGSDSMIIYLQGGGACWTGFNLLCSTMPEPTLIPLAYMNDADPENAFKDWNVLYVPYCDGSVFIGDNDFPDDQFPDGVRRHHGRRNVSAALDIALEHLPQPSRIFLSGLSAGGYGTISAAALVRLAYPDAELFVYNDSGPGVQDTTDTVNVEARIEEWRLDRIIPDSCTGCAEGRGQFTEFIAWMLENDPTMKVGYLGYYQDGTIGGTFLKLAGPDYQALMLEETGAVHERFPDRYRRFLLPGSSHVVTLEWPNVEVEGVTVRQWAEALVSGDDAWQDLLSPMGN